MISWGKEACNGTSKHLHRKHQMCSISAARMSVGLLHLYVCSKKPIRSLITLLIPYYIAFNLHDCDAEKSICWMQYLICCGQCCDFYGRQAGTIAFASFTGSQTTYNLTHLLTKATLRSLVSKCSWMLNNIDWFLIVHGGKSKSQFFSMGAFCSQYEKGLWTTKWQQSTIQ